MASGFARVGLGWILSESPLPKVVKYCNRLPGAVVGSPSLDVFKRHAAVALRDVF